MILLADLGNDAFSVAIYSDDKKKLYSYKTFTDKLKSESEYCASLTQFFTYQNINIDMIEGSLLSSVVPSLTKRIQRSIEEVTKTDCLVLNKTLKTGLAIRMDNPSEVGSDLLATAIGAYSNYHQDTLIIDLSSVVSFTIVSEKKEFIGGLLFPGLKESSLNMMNNNAQLMDIDLETPKRLIGKSTKESMNSGIVNGYVSLIRSLSAGIENEYKKPLIKVITGSDSNIIKDLLPEYEHNQDLVFEGLFEIYIKNKVR